MSNAISSNIRFCEQIAQTRFSRSAAFLTNPAEVPQTLKKRSALRLLELAITNRAKANAAQLTIFFNHRGPRRER